MKMKPEDKKSNKLYQETQLDIFILEASELLIKIRDAFIKINDPDFRLKIYIDYITWNVNASNFLANVENFDYFTRWLTIKEFQPKKYPKFNMPIDEMGGEIRDKIVNDLNELKSIIGEKKVILDKIKNIKKLTEKDRKTPRKTDYKNGILHFGDKEIDFNNKQNQKDLLATLFKDANKNWFYDEIQGEWDEEWDGIKKNNPVSKKYWKKFYSAGDDINTAIAKKTQIEDFIIKNTKEIRINPKYV